MVGKTRAAKPIGPTPRAEWTPKLSLVDTGRIMQRYLSCSLTSRYLSYLNSAIATRNTWPEIIDNVLSYRIDTSGVILEVENLGSSEKVLNIESCESEFRHFANPPFLISKIFYHIKQEIQKPRKVIPIVLLNIHFINRLEIEPTNNSLLLTKPATIRFNK